MPNIEQIDIIAFNRGDFKIFKKLFDRYYRVLCSYVYDMIKDSSATDDLVQDLFVRLWEKRVHFDCQEKIVSFLFVSARNSCINLTKHEKMKQEKLKIWKQESTSAESDSLLLMEEFDNMLKNWLDNLPSECRKVIELSIEGKKNQEIAELLQLSVNTVKNQKVKGFKILRTLYKDEYWLILLYASHLFK